MDNLKAILKKRSSKWIGGILIVVLLLIGATFVARPTTLNIKNQVLHEYYMNSKTHKLTREYSYCGSTKYTVGKTYHYHNQNYINVKNNVYVKANYISYLKQHPSNPKYSQKLVNAQFIKEYREGALATINKFRKQNGRSPVTLSNKLNRVAQRRAYQVMEPKNKSLWADGESIHYNSKHQGVGALDAVAMGIFKNYKQASATMSENLATESNELFNNNSINTVYISKSQAYRGGCGFMKLYLNEGPTGGHYQNLLAPTRKSVGIGFGAKKDQVSDVEEFADQHMS